MKKIVVAGGGLVGSLVAVMMKKRGYQVLLLEKRPDIRKNKTGAGRSINLIVTSRGLNALKKVGLLEEVFKMTVPVTGRMIHAKNGETSFQAYGRNPGECNHSISRAELNRFLLSACEKNGVQIIFDSAVENADVRQKLLCVRQDGKSVSVNYDIMLGTDGAGSILRSEMKRAMGSEFQDSTEFLSSDYKELFLPVSSSGAPALDAGALHIWPRGSHMLMALPNLDGSFTMTLYLPKAGSTYSFEQLTTKNAVEQFLMTEFPDALPLMPNAVKDFMENPQGALGTVRSAPWIYQDSVALVGDAAHAIVPFFGQGMNLGFEDCIYLDQFLNEAKDDWSEALKRYDEFQRPNANAIAEMALENFVEMRDQVADPHFMLKKKIEARIEKEIPEAYRSRYGMITYTLIPYALAQSAGRIQEELLETLSQGLASESDLNMVHAKKLVTEKFLPFIQKHHLSMEKFQVNS